jgi:ATP-dependent DNA helicase RecQ
MESTEKISSEAFACLRRCYGEGAEFREGQLEAIVAVMQGRRSLVVEKTGWGKSLVYFIATRMLRDRGKGPTVVISPLLALMRNQIDNAKKLNIRAARFTSDNEDEHDEILENLRRDEIDLLLMSPERLGKTDDMEAIISVTRKGIGFFVIDEAHCISEWGHDFRPDYMRIRNFLQLIPQGTPILGTTATANKRVVEDIRNQLGKDIFISRGPLARDSLKIQVVKLDSQEEKFAWLLQTVPKLKGTGLIYCLTVRDCKIVAMWLQAHGINARAYWGSQDDAEREKLEDDFFFNRIKVLVATTALGMGYDKPDIAFVIHYQRPGSLIAYYQQIGRAGRSIPEAYAVLMVGREDEKILEYFRNTAFPSDENLEQVTKCIRESAEPLSLSEFTEKLNLKRGDISKCLKFLEINSAIFKRRISGRFRYVLNPNSAFNGHLLDREQTIAKREAEDEEMQNFINTSSCYMEFVEKSLDDEHPVRCGRCANCAGMFFPDQVTDQALIKEAYDFLKQQVIMFSLRKNNPFGGRLDVDDKIKGLALSVYDEGRIGHLVKQGKYVDGKFSEKLADFAIETFKNKRWPGVRIDFVAYVPSLRKPNLVKDFAHLLADKMERQCFDLIVKTKNNPQQKTMENSAYQYSNVADCFDLANGYDIRGKTCLLVDDMVDSKWTFTAISLLLRQNGVAAVYPFALASSGASVDE